MCTEAGRSRGYRWGITSVYLEWSSCFILEIAMNVLFGALSLAAGASSHFFDEIIQNWMLLSLKNQFSPNRYEEMFPSTAVS